MRGILFYFGGSRNTEHGSKCRIGGFPPFLISYRVFKSKLKYKT